MDAAHIARWTRTAAALVLTAALPGCVVTEMQQSLDETNASLRLIREDLAGLRVSADRIAQMDEDIRRMEDEVAALRETTGRIAELDEEIDAGVQQLDSVGASLGDLDAQLTTVSASLRELDLHLGSLRRTLQKVNRIVPFVDVADDAPVNAPDGK